MKTFLGLGSNIENRYNNLQLGLKCLNDHPHIWIINESYIYIQVASHCSAVASRGLGWFYSCANSVADGFCRGRVQSTEGFCRGRIMSLPEYAAAGFCSQQLALGHRKRRSAGWAAA